MNLRFAEEKDILAIVGCVKLYAEEAGEWCYNHFDEEEAVKAVTLDIPDTIVIDKDGEIAGIMTLKTQVFPWSKLTFISERILFVKIEHRKSRFGYLLVAASKKIAKSLNTPLIVSSFNGIDLEKKTLFYNRMGFKQLGGMYMYNGEINA